MQTQNKEKFVWWEKSVEYKFIYEMVKSNRFSLLAPLDGSEEKLGDLLVAKDAKYVIIEFKKDVNCFSSEYKKYQTNEDPGGQIRFSEAKKSLGKYNHHFLVAGELTNNEDPILRIKIYKYFSCPSSEPITIEDALDSGVPKEEFDNYALALSEFKTNLQDNEETESSSSGGRAKSIVIGVSPTKGLTFIELEIYRKLTLNSRPKTSPSNRS